MKKINFSTTINAPKEKVWKVLWDLASYEKWTRPFSEGSTVKTDNWKQGSKILFLDGKGSGMVSEVVANRPNEHMSFKHLGEVKDGVEDTTSEAVKLWSGATENYTLTEKNGKTELLVEMDTAWADFEEFLAKTWPNAMEIIKQMAEAPENRKKITVQSTVKAPVEKVWSTWTKPEHITKWCNASDDWHAPHAENDVREGGIFKTRMEAKDGSNGFDFGGKYNKVKENDTIEYDMSDGRHVEIKFEKLGNDQTKVTETFDMENTHPEEMQRGGWQSILDNFKKYTESANQALN
jgi:uncharacterized protein YndB with AHSA1/START domain